MNRLIVLRMAAECLINNQIICINSVQDYIRHRSPLFKVSGITQQRYRHLSPWQRHEHMPTSAQAWLGNTLIPACGDVLADGRNHADAFTCAIA
jgi:hypothetical protein